MVRGHKKKVERVAIPIDEAELETGKQIDFMSDLLLTVTLTARHDVLNRIGKVGPATVRFSEWDRAIDMLANAQGLKAEALEPVRRLVTSVARDMVGTAKKGVMTELRELTAEAIREGISVSEFQSWLNHYAENNGYAEAKPYLVENLYRTESGIGYGIGERAAYADPDIAGGLWGFRYIATKDDRVRPDHWALNNTALPKDHPFWQTHWPGAWDWQCRCSHELIFEDETHRTKRPPEIEEKGFDISLKSTVNRLLDEIAAL